jgi:hypothetical protein
MNIKQKITSAIAIGTMMAAVVAPASFAATTVTATGNGALSTNKVGVVNLSKKSVKQKNSTVAITKVTAKANTGKNTSSFNTGGSSSITTGAATNTVAVVVEGGTNTNSGDECGCVAPTTDVTISDNGALSHNGVLVVNASSNSLYQSNSTVAVTSVSTSSNTGGNTSSFNTNGGSTIDSGEATNDVTVAVGGSTNTN